MRYAQIAGMFLIARETALLLGDRKKAYTYFYYPMVFVIHKVLFSKMIMIANI
jgi:hypothetical protein